MVYSIGMKPILHAPALRLLFCLASPLCLAGQTPAGQAQVRSLMPGPVIGAGTMRDKISYSPDGRLLAIPTAFGFQVLDAKSGLVLNTVVRRLGKDEYSGGLCWSPDGKRIAQESNGIELWTPNGAALERRFPIEAEDQFYADLAWSPTGDRIAARIEYGTVVFDVASGRRSEIPSDLIHFVSVAVPFSWAPDGKRLAIVGAAPDQEWYSQVIDVWDVQGMKRLNRFAVGPQRAPLPNDATETAQTTVAWSPNGRLFALSSIITGLSVWDAHTGKLLQRFRQAAKVISLSWSKDSKLLRVGTPWQIRLLSVSTGQPVYALESSFEMGENAVSADGNQFAAGSADGDEIDLWHGKDDPHPTRIPAGNINGVVALSRDGRRIAAGIWGGSDGSLGLFDVGSGRETAVLRNWKLLSSSPDGELVVVSGAVDGKTTVNLDRTSDGSLVRSIPKGPLSWSPDGKMVAVNRGFSQPATDKDGLELISLTGDGKVVSIAQLDRNAYFNTVSAWSPDGKYAVLEGRRKVIYSLEDGSAADAPPGKGKLLWSGPGDPKWSSIPAADHFVQSPDSHYGAFCETSKLGIWDFRTDKPMLDPRSSTASCVGTPAWSSGSDRIAYIASKQRVDVWDVARAQVAVHWDAPGSSELTEVFWRDKLMAVDTLGSAIRLWRETQ